MLLPLARAPTPVVYTLRLACTDAVPVRRRHRCLPGACCPLLAPSSVPCLRLAMAPDFALFTVPPVVPGGPMSAVSGRL